MNRNQRAALANPNLEFGASTFLGQPVGPNQMLLVYEDRTGEDIPFVLKSLLVCPDGSQFPKDYTANASLELVVLPSNFSVLQNGEEALVGNRQLKTIIGIENLEVIPAVFCAECASLEFSKLNATEIGETAFAECNALSRVELPNVTDIHSQAFMGCENLTVILNDNVVNVGVEVFIGIDNLIYHGSLPGAPWGATKWNGVPQN